jgi:hypothetical protein
MPPPQGLPRRLFLDTPSPGRKNASPAQLAREIAHDWTMAVGAPRIQLWEWSGLVNDWPRFQTA